MPQRGSTAEELRIRADQAYEESRYAEAARLYARLARVLPTWSEEWYTCQLHRAHCLRLAGSFRHAIRLYRQLRQKDADGTTLEALDALVGEALALRAAGQLRAAHNLLLHALQGYRQHNDSEGIVHTLWALGTTLRFAGDFRPARLYLQEALRLHRRFRLGSPTYLYCALGGLSRMQGAVKRSLAYYLRAHHHALRTEDTFGIAYSACGIANAYRMLQLWEPAHHYFTLARLHYESIGERLSHAYTLWGQATAYLLQHHWEQSEELLTMAETLFRQTGDRRGLIYVTLTRLQQHFLRTGSLPERLREDFFHALRRSQRHGYRFETLHLQLLGTVTGLLTPPASLEALRRGYRACGSLWFQGQSLTTLPLNIP